MSQGVLKISTETGQTLTDVAENMVQLELHQGALNLHVRRLYDNEKYEVDTPNQAFTVLKPGDYRFDVYPDNDKTVVTVWSGEGEASGDGWKYRGRGLIQITFHDNYAAYAGAVADPTILTAPDQVAQPQHAVLSACWFWHSKGLNALADAGTQASFNQISLKINGGWNGKDDRLENWAEARSVMLA